MLRALRGLSGEKVSCLLEIAVSLAVFVTAQALSTVWHVPFPGAVAVVITVAVILGVLPSRRVGWRALGLRRPGSWGKSALLLVATLAAVVVFVFALMPEITRVLGPLREAREFGRMEGDFRTFMTYVILLGWGSAAFGEEILFRGFLLTRLAGLLGRTVWGEVTAVVVQAAVFGIAHGTGGLSAVVVTGCIGLLLGSAYVLGGRNLWVVVTAHGAVNTWAFAETFLGVQRG